MTHPHVFALEGLLVQYLLNILVGSHLVGLPAHLKHQTPVACVDTPDLRQLENAAKGIFTAALYQKRMCGRS